jgi:hypothetical protein
MTEKENDIFSVWNRDYSKITRLEAQKHIETIFGSTATPYEISTVLEKAYEALGVKRMFIEVNRDCSLTGESVAEFGDVAYYSQQIESVYGLSPILAADCAEMMAEMDVEPTSI